MCGEAVHSILLSSTGTGPSPRVRGSPCREGEPAGRGGSIPACAGKPCCRLPLVIRTGVHPRVCGEAQLVDSGLSARQGPSPRVRGSHTARIDPLSALGSIPACAGKPPRKPPRACRRRVHPRVCGEASQPPSLTTTPSGPSPRVRGSLAEYLEGAEYPGSIPACAGKPCSRSGRSATPRVHPRVCGGSRLVGVGQGYAVGSIPACAGKPAI